VVLAGPAGESAHDGGAHPESPARVVAAMKGIADLHLGADLVAVDVRPASRDELARVHSLEYLDELEAFSGRGGGSLDADTFVTSDSWDAACRAAGAGLAAVAELERRGDGVGFVAARPPGHHAVRSRGMGFCLLNNVAVTAASLVAGGARVAIVDWDVHHGNGTQEIFWDEPDVLYVSTHQSPLYPGTGRPDEIGGAAARGKTVNVPLPPGATGDVVSLAFNEILGPAVDAFGPDWILVSCGFDAHRADPLAELALSSADFAALAAAVQQLAPSGGRIALFLEGGYDLQAVRRSTASTIGALVGDLASPEDPTFGGPGTDTVRASAVLRERALLEAEEERSGGGNLDGPHTGSVRASTTRLRENW